MEFFIFALLALTQLIPLTEAAIVINILTLANAVVMLGRGWRHIAAKPMLLSLTGALPMVVAGYALLDFLASESLAVVRMVLGLVILLSSMQLIRRYSPLDTESSGPVFAAYGAIGGLMGGLFSTAGPPLVYQFYRQPMSHAVIRETLVAIFAINSLSRLALVTIAGQWQNHTLLWALAGLPSVVAASYIARRWPPPVSASALRRSVFVLLLLSGLSLIVPAISHLP
ncbi:TSUP family transporter [Brucella endophytica]|uniref:TSUP family transporter n=1 Tax=Brucella endophytica TaxID=1963359 RepID=UPI001665322C|nr:TSUP family transporter [Brucella endophytica]